MSTFTRSPSSTNIGTWISAPVSSTAGFMALSAREQGQKNADLYQDTQPDAERTRHLALAADIGFGAAVVFGATVAFLRAKT